MSIESPTDIFFVDSQCNDVSHLQKANNMAVALCRAPNLTLFVFSLPDCRVLQVELFLLIYRDS
jgi:hypothetical protein